MNLGNINTQTSQFNNELNPNPKTTLLSVTEDKFTPLSWPPTDDDFIRVATWAARNKKDFSRVLVYVKYSPKESILIYDPVHIGPAPRESRHLTVTYRETGEDKTIEVILAEDD